MEGKNPDKVILERRAIKATEILKNVFDGKIKLPEEEVNILKAIVVQCTDDNFYFFARHILGFDLLTSITHRRWADDLVKSIQSGRRRVMRLKPRKTYKCLKKGTELLNYGIDDKFNIIDTELFNQGDFVEDGIEVVLASGRKHICTKDHMFKTLEGWSTAKVGERIAIARKLNNPYIPINEGEEYLMGLLVGDGCLRKSTPKLSCCDRELLDKLREYGFKLSKSGTNQLRCDYNILGFYDKIRSCRLEGTNSWTKFIPKKYEGSPHFLRGLFDADGTVAKRNPMIVFVTVSEQLADDVLRNLMYFGIVARKHYYEYAKTEKSPEVKCFHVSIAGEFIYCYARHIGFNHKEKSRRLRHWTTGEYSRPRLNPNLDTIPSGWKSWLKYDEKRKIRYDAGIRIDNHYCHSRSKVRKCGEFVNNQDIIDLANAGIFWDRIVSVKDVGKIEFSAVGSSTENYISSDGVIHHNTTLYGISFILWLWAAQSPQIRIFYTSVNKNLLEEVADSLDRFIGSTKSDTFLSYVFGIVRDSDAKNTSDVFNIQGRSGKGFSLLLRTSGGSTVGLHPNIIIIDDCQDNNDRDSLTTREMKVRWFDSLGPLLVPFKNQKNGILFESIYFIGTVWHMHDLIWHIVEKNKTLPEKQKWDIERESIVGRDGKTFYPDFISDEKIAELKHDTGSEVFWSCQYLNSALSEGLQMFDLKRLSFIRPDQLDLTKGELLCVFDPSLGKSSSDYPAVWWVHHHEDHLTFFDAIDKKTELSLLVHYIASRNKEYGCRKIRFEDNGTILIKESLQRAHKAIDHNIIIDSVHHSTPKSERIISIQSDLYSGFARFMSDYETRYPEAMNQIVFYGAYGADDFPDCAQIAIEYFRQKRFRFVRYEGLL